METRPQESVKRVGLSFINGAFAVALALLFVLLLRTIAIQIAAPAKPADSPYPDTSTEEKCKNAGGAWVPVQEAKGGYAAPVAEDRTTAPQYFCQGPLAFERERDLKDEKSRQATLFVFAVGGAIAAGFGLFLKKVKALAPGMLLGSIVSFFVAVVSVWQMAPGLGQLAVIAVLFVALAVFAYVIFREKPQQPQV